jgi:hypothetical protein
MAVSANTLFHFTKVKGLEGILKSMGFYCQYSDEHFENILPKSSDHRFVYTPMISFCDLTIMQLAKDSSHRKYFGDYGIGLKKSWGTSNGITPVMYVHRSSQATKQFPELINVTNRIESLLLKKGVDYITTSKMKEELVDSLKYIKPYKGNWHKGKKIKKLIIYYNEREWRYCPKLEEHPILSGIIKENKNQIDLINKDLRQRIIKFQPKDIKFILIKNKKETIRFMKHIESLGLTDNEENDLIRKLRTFQEIQEDY